MARNIDSKCKQCRREGTKLFLKGDRCTSPSCALLKRNYVPGMHGPTQKGSRLSSYGKQLREKQKAKKTYRLLEKQFRSYYDKAVQKSGDTAENFTQLLETRLDNVVYRLGLAVSRDLARQLIGHGHILVNDKKVTIPSYQVKVGQTVSFKKISADKPFIKDRLGKFKKTQAPAWLNLDAEKLCGQVVALPKKEDVASPFELTLIIESYSR